jgi:hypothetical protein
MKVEGELYGVGSAGRGGEKGKESEKVKRTEVHYVNIRRQHNETHQKWGGVKEGENVTEG